MDGLGHPFFGLIFSRVMPLLVAPITPENKEDIIAEIKLWSGLVACVGLLMFVSLTGSKWAFGILGENVTFHIRRDLYKAILRKNIGFHDHRENGSSVLTSAMAEDSAVINGVSTESLGPQVDGFAGLLIAIVIGFIFSWKVSLSCLAIAPFMSIGQYI
jgi:ABC-type multidrug transport system fused ATPase/permease subunit